jgi:putative zinc finger/helix-turn-helix YgiT family protein
MRCLNCGTGLERNRENYLYTDSGLPHVTLVGVEVRRCRSCGGHSVVIPAMEQLHRVIAEAVVRKPNQLTREEFRFLRKHLGMSGREFAESVATTPETLSRWENGGLPLPGQMDRLVRLMVATSDRAIDYSIDELRQLGESREPMNIGVVRENDRWALAA